MKDMTGYSWLSMVARLATVALWVRIQTSPKLLNGDKIQKGGEHTLTSRKIRKSWTRLLEI
jgi:hypothetical protein